VTAPDLRELEQALRAASVAASRAAELDLYEDVLRLLEVATERRRRRERMGSAH
jgi:hypothetical protein